MNEVSLLDRMGWPPMDVPNRDQKKNFCEPQHNGFFEAKFAESNVESFRQLNRVSECNAHVPLSSM